MGGVEAVEEGFFVESVDVGALVEVDGLVRVVAACGEECYKEQEDVVSKYVDGAIHGWLIGVGLEAES